MGNLLCTGLILRFRVIPTPWGLDHADNRLATGMDVDMLTFCWPLPRWRLSASKREV